MCTLLIIARMAERPLENLIEDLTLSDEDLAGQVNANALMDSPQGQPNSHDHPVEGHDAKKTKLIQQQLVLLLHANKCLQREAENPSHVCNLPYCRTMKDVLRHMMQCQESNNCKYSHCVSSRQIIMHWKQCGPHDCSICTPVKGVITPGSVPADQPPVVQHHQQPPMKQDQTNSEPDDPDKEMYIG